MDQITKQQLNEFCQEYGLDKLDDSLQFEYFASWLVLSKFHREMFDLDDVHIGGGGDLGIDSLAFLVNGKLVTTTDAIEQISEYSGYLNVDIIFIQSTISQNFDAKKITTLLTNTRLFFDTNPTFASYTNEKLKLAREKWDKIVDLSPKMSKRLPDLYIYYVCTGRWQNDNYLLDIIDNSKSEIDRLNMFENINFEHCDVRGIRDLFRGIRNKLEVTIDFPDRLTLPPINDIEQAYYGLLRFSEFRKLICDENGNMFNVFYHNIRDFQGTENPVNKNIATTLQQGFFDRFSVLNNGITIVASSMTAIGNRFTLQDYQVVNGCQTSNVLYENFDVAGIETTWIPVRVIVTDREDLRNQITVATNSQTVIKPEQLAAQTDFQKNLEEFYKTTNDTPELFYERREGQYRSDSSIPKLRIVSLQRQIQ